MESVLGHSVTIIFENIAYSLYSRWRMLLDMHFYPFDITKARMMIKVCFSLSPVFSIVCVCLCVRERDMLLMWKFLEQVEQSNTLLVSNKTSRVNLLSHSLPPETWPHASLGM